MRCSLEGQIRYKVIVLTAMSKIHREGKKKARWWLQLHSPSPFYMQYTKPGTEGSFKALLGPKAALLGASIKSKPLGKQGLMFCLD